MIPKDVKDWATRGNDDKEYQDLIRFFEGEQKWEEAEGDILSYKNLKDTIGVDKFGEGKMLVVDDVKIIPPHSATSELVSILHSTHKGADTVLRTAHALYYWPGMSNAIHQQV